MRVGRNVGARCCARGAGAGWRRPAQWGRAAQGEAHATAPMQLRGGGIILRTLYKVCVVLSFSLSRAPSLPSLSHSLSMSLSLARSLSRSLACSLAVSVYPAVYVSACLAVCSSVCPSVWEEDTCMSHMGRRTHACLLASLSLCWSVCPSVCLPVRDVRVCIVCGVCSTPLTDRLPASVAYAEEDTCMAHAEDDTCMPTSKYALHARARTHTHTQAARARTHGCPHSL